MENINFDKVQKILLHIGGTTNIFDRERVREKKRELERDREWEIKIDREKVKERAREKDRVIFK